MEDHTDRRVHRELEVTQKIWFGLKAQGFDRNEILSVARNIVVLMLRTVPSPKAAEMLFEGWTQEVWCLFNGCAETVSPTSSNTSADEATVH